MNPGRCRSPIAPVADRVIRVTAHLALEPTRVLQYFTTAELLAHWRAEVENYEQLQRSDGQSQ